MGNDIPEPIYHGQDLNFTGTYTEYTLINPKPQISIDNTKRNAETKTKIGGEGYQVPPRPFSPSLSKFKRVLRNLTQTIESTRCELMAGSLQKCRLQFLLEELKNSMNAGKNILMNEDCGDENYDGMETQLADARNLICEITDKIDCLNTNEALRKQLPSAHWASWNGEAEGYLDFKLSMKTHLNSLTSEKLKLSTLKSKITGKSAEKIKMELIGVQSLAQAFQI